MGPPAPLVASSSMEDVMRVVLTCLPAPPFPATGGAGSRSASSVSGRGGGGADRISRLPDAVLYGIVSRLPARDAARTAALSRRWRRVWASAPLVLDDSDLLARARARARARGRPADAESPDFDWLGVTWAVSRALAAHRGPIRSVRLTCCFMALAVDLGDLARWLRLLAAWAVEDLVLVNRPLPFSLPLPSGVFRVASLRSLYLGFWRFPDAADLPRGPAVFPHLKELGLCHTVASARDIDHLLGCSPVLQKLAIVASFCSNPHIRIRSRSLQCVVFWKSLAEELAVVVAPRLQRLILWEAPPGVPDYCLHTTVRIGHATGLKVLGYLEPSTHQLEIGGTIIESGTKMIPSTMVPSVEILALKVRFEIRKEAKMLPTFLRCFPNVQTLHVLSHETDELTGKLNLKFWQEVGPINCLETCITKVVLHKFKGERYELAFLRFILERAQSLLKLVVVLANADPASADEMLTKLNPLATAKRASECPTLLVVAREGGSSWCFQRACDLSVSDPFD